MNHFEVGEQIGRGGFANVYSARDIRDGKQVALKIIKKELMQQELLFRVENEIRIHHQLKHSNVVQLYEYFQDDDNIYLVLEYCSGGNLFQYLRHHQRLPESIAVHVIKQLLSALAYLHEHSIVHRDLKLSNILVVDQWNAPNVEQQITVKLCDFGLAIQLKTTHEEHHTICGTPNFIAPEVALQQNHAFPADIWSIGCLFYTLLAGVPPFEHGNVQDTFGAIVRVEYQLEPLQHIISPEGQQFLESLLQLDPNIRPNAHVLLHQHPLFQQKQYAYQQPAMRDLPSLISNSNTTTSHTTAVLSYATTSTQQTASTRQPEEKQLIGTPSLSMIPDERMGGQKSREEIKEQGMIHKTNPEKQQQIPASGMKYVANPDEDTISQQIMQRNRHHERMAISKGEQNRINHVNQLLSPSRDLMRNSFPPPIHETVTQTREQLHAISISSIHSIHHEPQPHRYDHQSSTMMEGQNSSTNSMFDTSWLDVSSIKDSISGFSTTSSSNPLISHHPAQALPPAYYDSPQRNVHPMPSYPPSSSVRNSWPASSANILHTTSPQHFHSTPPSSSSMRHMLHPNHPHSDYHSSLPHPHHEHKYDLSLRHSVTALPQYTPSFPPSAPIQPFPVTHTAVPSISPPSSSQKATVSTQGLQESIAIWWKLNEYFRLHQYYTASYQSYYVYTKHQQCLIQNRQQHICFLSPISNTSNTQQHSKWFVKVLFHAESKEEMVYIGRIAREEMEAVEDYMVKQHRYTPQTTGLLGKPLTTTAAATVAGAAVAGTGGGIGPAESKKNERKKELKERTKEHIFCGGELQDPALMQSLFQLQPPQTHTPTTTIPSHMKAMKRQHLEAFLATKSTEEAQEILQNDKNRRVFRMCTILSLVFPKLLQLFEGIQCYIPRIILYSTPSSSSSSAAASLLSSVRQVEVSGGSFRIFRTASSPQKKGHQQPSTTTTTTTTTAISGGTMKCMLMSNHPLPDLHIQWSDGTRLRYQLATGAIVITIPPSITTTTTTTTTTRTTTARTMTVKTAGSMIIEYDRHGRRQQPVMTKNDDEETTTKGLFWQGIFSSPFTPSAASSSASAASSSTNTIDSIPSQCAPYVAQCQEILLFIMNENQKLSQELEHLCKSSIAHHTTHHNHRVNESSAILTMPIVIHSNR